MTPSDTAHPAGENLSCPFCGSDRIDINEGGNSSWGRCRTCNAEGPVKPTYTEARAAWNTRLVARPQGEEGLVKEDRGWLLWKLDQLKYQVEVADPYLERLDRLIAALSGPHQEGLWRPISEAPRDGTAILAWPCELADGIVAAPASWYVHPSVQGWITPLLDCGDYEFEPTYWQPLPAPPALSNQGKPAS